MLSKSNVESISAEPRETAQVHEQQNVFTSWLQLSEEAFPNGLVWSGIFVSCKTAVWRLGLLENWECDLLHVIPDLCKNFIEIQKH